MIINVVDMKQETLVLTIMSVLPIYLYNQLLCSCLYWNHPKAATTVFVEITSEGAQPSHTDKNKIEH